MELLALINVLEASDLSRVAVNVKSSDYEQETVSYTGNTVMVSVNGESYSNINQICIVLQENVYYVYLQDTYLRHYKFLVSTVETFERV